MTARAAMRVAPYTVSQGVAGEAGCNDGYSATAGPTPIMDTAPRQDLRR